MRIKKNIIGLTFNKLTVVEELKNDYFICKCACGTLKSIYRYHFMSGRTQSCGCVIREIARKQMQEKHKNSDHRLQHPLYKTYTNMINRCYHKAHKQYKYYGGRGIIVCEEWRNNFWKFVEDMVHSNGLTLDRIDNNKGYSKDNCRWATYKQQANNKRNNATLVVR